MPRNLVSASASMTPPLAIKELEWVLFRYGSYNLHVFDPPPNQSGNQLSHSLLTAMHPPQKTSYKDVWIVWMDRIIPFKILT